MTKEQTNSWEENEQWLQTTDGKVYTILKKAEPLDCWEAYDEVFAGIRDLISQEKEKMIEKIRNFNPEYGELGAAIPDFKERLINLLQNK